MTDLFVSPLLLPHLYDRSPMAWESAKNTKLWGTALNQDLKMSIRDGVLHLSEYNVHRFPSSSSYTYPLAINAKLAKILEGQTLDCLIDMPEANKCRITHCDGSQVHFQHERPNYDFDMAPKHSDKSYKAREDRKVIEAYAQRKFSWMAANVLRKASKIMGPQKLIAYHTRNIMFTGAMLQDPAIAAVKIDFSGSVSDIAFTNDVVVKHEKASLPGNLPEVVISSLPGKRAESIIDHWIFAGGHVKSIKQFSKKATIAFDGPSRRVFNQIIDGEISAAVRAARDREAQALSKEFVEYETNIAAQQKIALQKDLQ